SGLGDCVEMHVSGGRYVGVAPLEQPDDGDLCNVAMVVDEARDGHRLAGRPQAFLLESLKTFPGLRDRLDGISGARRALARSRLHTRVRRFSDAGLLLVGDAAGYYDPFTGEGIARALRSAQIAREIALSACSVGDLSASYLARYDRAMRHEMRGKRTIE